MSLVPISILSLVSVGEKGTVLGKVLCRSSSELDCFKEREQTLLKVKPPLKENLAVVVLGRGYGL